MIDAGNATTDYTYSILMQHTHTDTHTHTHTYTHTYTLTHTCTHIHTHTHTCNTHKHTHTYTHTHTHTHTDHIDLHSSLPLTLGLSQPQWAGDAYAGIPVLSLTTQEEKQSIALCDGATLGIKRHSCCLHVKIITCHNNKSTSIIIKIILYLVNLHQKGTCMLL